MRFLGRVHLGRKGLTMIVLALLWVWIGTNITISDAPPHPGLLHTQWPTWVRMAEWYASAAIALAFCWRQVDWPGWAALLLPPALRVGSYIWGWVVYVTHPDEGSVGYANGLWASCLYIAMMAIVLILAGWPDYPPRNRPTRHLAAVQEADHPSED